MDVLKIPTVTATLVCSWSACLLCSGLTRSSTGRCNHQQEDFLPGSRTTRHSIDFSTMTMTAALFLFPCTCPLFAHKNLLLPRCGLGHGSHTLTAWAAFFLFPSICPFCSQALLLRLCRPVWVPAGPTAGLLLPGCGLGHGSHTLTAWATAHAVWAMPGGGVPTGRAGPQPWGHAWPAEEAAVQLALVTDRRGAASRWGPASRGKTIKNKNK